MFFKSIYVRKNFPYFYVAIGAFDLFYESLIKLVKLLFNKYLNETLLCFLRVLCGRISLTEQIT